MSISDCRHWRGSAAGRRFRCNASSVSAIGIPASSKFGFPNVWTVEASVRLPVAGDASFVAEPNSFAGCLITKTCDVLPEPAWWNRFGGGQQEPDAAGAFWDRRIALPPGRALASAACSSEQDTSHKSACLVRTGTDPDGALHTGSRHRTPRKALRPNRDDRGSRFEPSR